MKISWQPYLGLDFRPRHLRTVQRCGLLLQVSRTQVSCAKTSELIEMLFGGWLIWFQWTMY